MGNDILTGMLIGDALSRDYSNSGGAASAAAVQAAITAEAAAAEADRAARHANSMEAATVAAIEHVVSWRQRAMDLRSGLKARKMSETLLLEALQKENPQHPLASRQAVEEIVDHVLDVEYGVWDADPQAYAEATMQPGAVPVTDQELAALREKYLPAKPSHPATGGAGEEHESHGHDGAGMESAPKG